MKRLKELTLLVRQRNRIGQEGRWSVLIGPLGFLSFFSLAKSIH